MRKIYQIDCSARKEGSTSRKLAQKLLKKIKKNDDQLIYRDLDDEMLFISGLTESGMKIDKKDQTEHHKKMFELSDKLVKELKQSDIIIISAPIYNFGPPATLKAWADLAARVKLTFNYSEDGERIGLLEDKQVYLVITSGGTKIQGDEDYLTPWLIHMLNFFGIKNIKIIAADQMALDYEKSIKQAENKIEALFKDSISFLNVAIYLLCYQSLNNTLVKIYYPHLDQKMFFHEVIYDYPSSLNLQALI